MSNLTSPPSVDSLLTFEADFPTQLLAQQWYQVLVRIAWSNDNSEKLRLLDMGYLGPEVDINRDFPQFPIVLEPGEKLQTVLSIRIAEPGFIKAGKFFLAYEIVPLNGQPKSAKDKTLPPADLACFPSPDKLLDIQIEPLCSYDDKGIKTEIVITPRGEYAFKDLRVHIEPPEKVISCQSIHRTMFPKKQATEKVSSRNGTSEMEKNNEIKLDALLQPGDIDFVVEFVALGSRTQVRLPRTVKIPEQIRHEKAQLLEPRRVFKPDIDVEEIRDSGDKKISDVRAAYPLHGGRKYKITIMPKPGDNVNKISMQDIHGRIQVRSANQTNYETQQGEHEKWTFEIEITFSELLRHSDRLHYIVESKDRSMFGEIFVVLLPPWYKGLLFAGAVGASATLQGFVALGRRIFTPDVSLKETVANLLAGHDYQIWFLLSIPVLWLLVWLADRAIYRLRS